MKNVTSIDVCQWLWCKGLPLPTKTLASRKGIDVNE